MTRMKVSKQTKIKYRSIAIDLGYSKECISAIMSANYDDEIQHLLLNERKRIEKQDECWERELFLLRKERNKNGKKQS